MYELEQQTLQFIEHLDASPGHALIRAMETEWFRSGVEAARSGQDSATLWNQFQRAGHRAWMATSAALAELREASPCAN